jgi:hypothetical protein
MYSDLNAELCGIILLYVRFADGLTGRVDLLQ